MERVAAILREATEHYIAPRFRTLESRDIEEKAPGETVTVADREAEAFIAARLREIAPGVPVVGEEAVAANPDLIQALTGSPRAWLVDPLDGTSNFASGSPHWATMAALVVDGEAVQAWIYRHGDGAVWQAERGSGATRDDVRVQVAAGPHDLAALRGAVLQRFLTDAERARMEPAFLAFGAITPGYSCAGYEYPALIQGEQEFAMFQRILPWDHVPGALLLTEAGGVARMTDGRPYGASTTGRGLLLANSGCTWETVRGTLYG